MEKSPIDPILKKQYEEEINRVSSEAARRALMNLPEEAIMEQPDRHVTLNPDREAEQKSEEAFMNSETQKWLNNSDGIASKREIKEEYESKKYFEQLGVKGTGLGPVFRGTTENLVGDSKNSLFTNFEDFMIKSKEKEVLDSMDKAGEQFIDKLPYGTPMPSADELKELKERPGGMFNKEPIDQDKAA
jgi:hypothetical protein